MTATILLLLFLFIYPASFALELLTVDQRVSFLFLNYLPTIEVSRDNLLFAAIKFLITELCRRFQMLLCLLLVFVDETILIIVAVILVVSYRSNYTARITAFLALVEQILDLLLGMSLIIGAII